ncbi:MAG TPA: META domain-containing protein [Acidobacteriaceae bacterium]
MKRSLHRMLIRLTLPLAFAVGLVAQTTVQTAPIAKTHWKLISVGDTKIPATTVREPFLELDPATHRMSGTGGCNQFTGSYELEGDHLRFSQTAATRMACAGGMDTDDALLKALDNTREWKVSGHRLSLLDADGRVVARFTAAPPQ